MLHAWRKDVSARMMPPDMILFAWNRCNDGDRILARILPDHHGACSTLV
jgi:hypothetical protein